MYGYVFLTTNSSTGIKFIGINRAVKFNPHYYGDTDAISKDLATYGERAFSVAMLMPYEDEKSLVRGLDVFIKKYDAQNDPSFYNSDKPAKRTRKKKVDDESLS